MNIEISEVFITYDGMPILGLMEQPDNQKYLFMGISKFKSYEYPTLCIECEDGVLQKYLNLECDLLVTIQNLLANGSKIFTTDLYDDELILDLIFNFDPKWLPESGFMASSHDDQNRS